MTRVDTLVQPCCGATLPTGERYVETTCADGHCTLLWCAECGTCLGAIGAQNCPCRDLKRRYR